MADDRIVDPAEGGLHRLSDELRRLREELQRQNQQNRNGDGAKEQKNGEDQQKKQEPEKDGDKGKQEDKKKPHPLRKALLIVAAVLLVGIALAWWLHARHFESTDDAFVDGHISGIAARVPATVVAVYVEENDFVKSGQVVVDLDPRDYKNALSQARGQGYLVRNIFQYNPHLQQMLAEAANRLTPHSGPALAMRQAYGLLYRQVQQQASVLAYIDVIWVMCFVSFIAIGLLFFARKTKPGQAMAH